jgi:OOP family OmpA-OmpF porin
MKLSRIALAMLVAAPLAAANAGITVTPFTWLHIPRQST